MSSYVYLLSFIVIACQFLIPIYLLVSLSIVANPLLVHIVEVEKFRYYKGTSAPNLTILFLLVLGSFLVRYILNKNTGSLETYEDLFLILLPIFIAQMTLVMLFEVKAPRSLFKKIISVYKDPRTLFIGDKLEFKEPEKKNITNQVGCAYLNSEAAQSKVSFKDRIKIEIGDIFLNLEKSKYYEIIKEHENLFKDAESKENLYKLTQGIEVEEKSIKIHCNNKRNSKSNINELLSSLFEIEKNWKSKEENWNSKEENWNSKEENWNSKEKGRTNKQKVDFLNKYIEFNNGDKKFHSNDFSRFFDSKK